MAISTAEIIEIAAKQQNAGTPFTPEQLQHARNVAEILTAFKLDQETVGAGLLWCLLPPTAIDQTALAKHYNAAIAKLLLHVMKINNMYAGQAKTHSARDAAYHHRLRQAILAMASDLRAVLILLAQHLDQLRHLSQLPTAEQTRLAQETRDLYAPLANRLGMGKLKAELEDLSFAHLNQEAYQTLVAALAEGHEAREQRIAEVITILQEHLTKAQITASISGRAKHVYSIYLKMKKKGVSHESIYDTCAVRILVPTITDCYAALSIVHSLWKNIPAEFDDYIAKPKANHYRSLHTAVIGPQHKNIEVQIRTYEMHDEAEHGISAHWVYKEHKSALTDDDTKIRYLQQLLAWHQELAENKNPDQPSMPTTAEDIYVFTPNGDIIELRYDATPLDFAYHIHSELGHRCRGAKVNGHIVPLTHALKTGDRVEIITAPHGQPSRDWLIKEYGYLKTSRGMSKVAQWFRQRELAHYIEIGKAALLRELHRLKVPLHEINQLAQKLRYKTSEALYAALGQGRLRLAQITAFFTPHAAPEAERDVTSPDIAPPKPNNLQIAGIDDLLTRIALCCKPIPGDDVIGYITQGRGVSIHRRTCKTLKQLAARQNHLLEVQWGNHNTQNFLVDLQLQAHGSTTVLKEIISILANHHTTLLRSKTIMSKSQHSAMITLTLQIDNMAHLQELISALRHLPHVHQVKRIGE